MRFIMSELYNESYYKNYSGTDYNEESVWVEHFGNIADRIITDFNPKTVLDAGCAFGYLVAALRDRGVQAYGIDISEYAISKVRNDIKQFCAVCSLTDKLPMNFPNKFDLITNIEVIEHLYENEGLLAIENMCKYSDKIIFSSTSTDIYDATHVNVQQKEYWISNFAKHGLFNKVDYMPNYISSDAVLFYRNDSVARIVGDYERQIRQNINRYEKEIQLRNDQVLRLDSLLTEKEKQINNINMSENIKDEDIKNYKKLIESKNLELKELNEVLVEKNNKIEKVNKELNIKNHTSELKDKSIKKLSEILKQREKEIIYFKENEQYENEEIKNSENQIKELENRIKELENQIKDYHNLVMWERGEKEKFTTAFYSISNSSMWKITKPFRVLLDIIKKIIRKVINNSIIRGLKKVFISVKTVGLKTTYKKIKNKINGVPNANYNVNILPSSSNISSLCKVTNNPVEAIPTIITEEKVKRLNFVTDSIGPNSLLGGVATALIVATEFANKCDFELRIITRTTNVNPVDYENIMDISGVEPAKHVSFYSDYDRDINGNKDFKLEISKDDIFFATSWWSAEAIKKTSIRKRFYYIIQEVETFFYPHGGEHYLCNQIMNDKNIDFIINSKFLYEYFKKNEPNIINNGTYFEPAFPNALYHPQSFVKKNKYKLFFYARPNNPRNLYSYGVNLLEKAISCGILDTSEWDIYCAGQEIPELRFSNGYTAINKGQMSWQDYGEFLGDIDLAVSLMYTPHPSYPPYDVACSGGVVVSNKCLNKEIFEQCKNVILSELNEKEFMSSLKEGIELAKNMTQRKENFENSTIPRKWNEVLDGAISFMKEKM